MSKRIRLTFGVVLGAAGLALALPACESVPLTAAPGTSMSLIANPTFVIANGGNSVVTAILVEPAGTFVPDGTEVFFFTNLGRIDASGKTVNGVARVNFVSDARSGIATISAISGGPAPAPVPSATPTPAGSLPGGDGAASASSVGGRAPAFGALAIAADQNSATVQITVGSALPTRVLVSANPPHISFGRPALLRAAVFDAQGNPVQNVPVAFSVEGIAVKLDSGGGFQYTNSNGEVTDTLRTGLPIGSGEGPVTVTATTANGIAGTAVVTFE
jgi:Big-like domain-containing protein